MTKIILILAGPPGTGKTYMANQIMSQDKEWKLLSYDDIKENCFDTLGFSNLEEKKELGLKAWDEYYNQLEDEFEKSTKVIIDYPFSYKQENTLKTIINKYGFNPITITLKGDIYELYKRQRERDLSEDRHVGHILTSYYKESLVKEPDDLDDFKTFKERCDKRKYDQFFIGENKQVDVSKFENIDIQEIIEWVNKTITQIDNKR
ncbi:AAA family ATPase [Mammaliicoccus sp. Dog046]|uniref:AAA family ATPase n=1 Tax=Mammaliicoccus sp. Dog046 TaxID=3034233 RepID=UPI002B25FFD9|nr:AAA family ATPase [Mammaliicoccus sp. Dog046]WQK85792.1 AAA family ATPase [Mammaliicoccus sp. Dog046]